MNPNLMSEDPVAKLTAQLEHTKRTNRHIMEAYALLSIEIGEKETELLASREKISFLDQRVQELLNEIMRLSPNYTNIGKE